jgi:hypothetical protein
MMGSESRSSDHTVPYRTETFLSIFPGISCQATITPSLRDNILTTVHKIDSTPKAYGATGSEAEASASV